MFGLFKRDIEKIILEERPQIKASIREISSGHLGFIRAIHQKRDYLIKYIEGLPSLYGRVVGKIRKTGQRKYEMPIIPSSRLNPQERNEVYSLLSRFW
jgi:hypothetical protein